MGNKNKLPDMLNKEQLVKLFENMFIPKLSIACFTSLMCGLRVNEVCSLEICDIDLQRRTIKIRDSKNPNRARNRGYGKDRIVIIPQIAISPIRKWLSVIDGGKYFLPSEKSPDKPLRKKTLHIWFAEARKRAGLDIEDLKVKYKKPTKYRSETTIYKYRFHHLRHFFATFLYEKTRDLYAVSRALGHNQVTTSQVYAKVSDKVLKDSVDFAFDIPIKVKAFEKNSTNIYQQNPIPNKDKSPLEILEQRFAKGEISISDFQNSLRLLKVKKDYFENGKDKKTELGKEVRVD